jgi:hypothetical protein
LAKVAVLDFTPVGIALVGSIGLIWYHPTGSPDWAIWGVSIVQVLSLTLTAIFLGPWQSKLSKDRHGSKSLYLANILTTHWLRTFLINASAFLLLAWVLQLAR